MTSYSIAVAGQALMHGAIDLVTPGVDSIRRLLSASDAALVNLEATVETEGSWPTKTKTLHLTTREGIESLRALGFDTLTHANNHAFDLGPPGIVNTRDTAEGHGFQLTGSGIDREAAARPALIQTGAGTIAVLSVDLGPQPDIVYASVSRAGINPLRIRRKTVVTPAEFDVLKTIVETLGDDRREAARAAVGYRSEVADTTGSLEIFGTQILQGAAIGNRYDPDPDDLATFEEQLAQVRAQSTLVAVALHNHHWDPNWQRTPEWVLDVSRRLIDSGVDLVFGTGAPVLQGISFHRNKPILAGLGNLIFHTRRAETYDRKGVDVWTGAVCRCLFDSTTRHCSMVEVLPIAVGRPSPAPGTIPSAPIPLSGAGAQRVFDRMCGDLDDADRARVMLLDPLLA